MKKLLSIILCLACALPLASCAGDKTAYKDALAFEGDELYAVAFVGYMDDGELEGYCDKYLVSDEVETYTLSGGEYYLVIPRYSDMGVKIEKTDIMTDEAEVVYEADTAAPFVVQCNVSDIFADCKITFERDGEQTEFSPYVSLKDGELEIGERGVNITEVKA